MTTANDKIIDRIRNLLAMAEGQANENESAQAMELAAKLMLKHGVEQSQLNPRQAHEILEGDMIDINKPFYRTLAGAVCHLYGTSYLFFPSTKTFRFVGRSDNIEASEATFTWILLQVEQLYKQALPKGMTTRERSRFRHTFKEACAHRVNVRAADIARNMTRDPLPQASTALVIHKDQLKHEIDSYFASKGNVKTARARRIKFTHAGAAAAGHAAGNNVKLNANIK